MSESVNLAAAGNETVQPSTNIDNPDNLNFWEPGYDEEPANSEQGAEGIEGEAIEGEVIEDDQAGETADDAEGDEPAIAENGEAANEADSQLVTLKGGEQVPLSELKLGYMRERDYRYKTQETANKGRALEAMTTRVTNTVKGIASYLAGRLPPEPPRSLAYQNPAEYTRQRAAYEDGLANINQIIAMSNDSTAVGGELASAASEETLLTENAKLLEAFPHLEKEDAREKFFADAFSVGQDLGFSQDEMQRFTDHRYFKVMHYAMLGLQAEQAKGKALAKVQNAPPAAVKAKPSGPANQQVRKNKEAMQRLSKTGSIKDAMSIDFD
uniref:hypothetical protein n=1 Tax=Ensifer adhaerens TaxID=106592 RepID=UPI003F4998C7